MRGGWFKRLVSGWGLPRYKFRWSSRPGEALGDLCHAQFDHASGFDPAELLQDTYGAGPKEDFVAEAWEALRERWLLHDKESRDQVVEATRTIRQEDGHATNRRAQMDYLRNLRNAKNLRAVVLRTLIGRGEIEPKPCWCISRRRWSTTRSPTPEPASPPR